MKLDFDNKTNQIMITEESNESLLSVQDSTKYTLCFKLKNGIYRIPYIAYPIITKIIRANDFNLEIGDNLKKFLFF